MLSQPHTLASCRRARFSDFSTRNDPDFVASALPLPPPHPTFSPQHPFIHEFIHLTAGVCLFIAGANKLGRAADHPIMHGECNEHIFAGTSQPSANCFAYHTVLYQ